MIWILRNCWQKSGEDYKEQLEEEIELLDGASAEFDMDLVSKGQLSPVFSDLR